MDHYVLAETSIPISNLYLDLNNPRFADEKDTKAFFASDLNEEQKQELCRRYLMRKCGGKALAESILQLGLLPIDRIVVRRIANNHFVAIEGNRRLAAIKTILWDEYRRAIKLPNQSLVALKNINVLVLTPQKHGKNLDTLLLQGARHISGIRNWGPYHQGRLIKALVDDEGMNYSEAARAIGLSPGRVSTLLRSFLGLKQMMEHPYFGKHANTSFFSHFEQAYLKIQVRRWLDWDDTKRKYTNNSGLHFFYKQITSFTEKGTPKLQAIDIRNKFPSVLEHEVAFKAYIEEQASIHTAYAMTQESSSGIVSHFLESAINLLDSIDSVSTLKLSNTDLETIRDINTFTNKIIKSKMEN